MLPEREARILRESQDTTSPLYFSRIQASMAYAHLCLEQARRADDQDRIREWETICEVLNRADVMVKPVPDIKFNPDKDELVTVPDLRFCERLMSLYGTQFFGPIPDFDTANTAVKRWYKVPISALIWLVRRYIALRIVGCRVRVSKSGQSTCSQCKAPVTDANVYCSKCGRLLSQWSEKTGEWENKFKASEQALTDSLWTTLERDMPHYIGEDALLDGREIRERREYVQMMKQRADWSAYVAQIQADKARAEHEKLIEAVNTYVGSRQWFEDQGKEVPYSIRLLEEREQRARDKAEEAEQRAAEEEYRKAMQDKTPYAIATKNRKRKERRDQYIRTYNHTKYRKDKSDVWQSRKDIPYFIVRASNGRKMRVWPGHPLFPKEMPKGMKKAQQERWIRYFGTEGVPETKAKFGAGNWRSWAEHYDERMQKQKELEEKDPPIPLSEQEAQQEESVD